MANDLISRSDLLETIRSDHPPFYDGQDIADWQEKCINEAPAVDAEPVRHGEWLPPAVGKYGCLCSECRLQADNDFDYCPNCGAKMDGV